LQIELKKKIKDLKLNKKIRINKSGCLDRCGLGPVMVIYPEGVWYSFKNSVDIDEILNSHLLNNKVVERLKI
jgi:(2Fe-2S) ferredoxin